MTVNETVLEMHYHRATIECFRRHFGVGDGTRKFHFYKYSPQREAFVGFDHSRYGSICRVSLSTFRRTIPEISP